jgi:hypothetical protein
VERLRARRSEDGFWRVPECRWLQVVFPSLNLMDSGDLLHPTLMIELVETLTSVDIVTVGRLEKNI